MLGEHEMGKVVEDRAHTATSQRYDSGFASGGNLPSSLHHPDYNRSDSGIGICEKFDKNLRITPATETETVKQKAAVSPVRSKQQAIIDYYHPDAEGDCQLHLAIADGVMEVVSALIRMAPSAELLDIQNNELYTPLHIAVLVNQPDMVRGLVVAGVATDSRDKEGNTPLHLAAKRGLERCAMALLSPISRDELQKAGATPCTNHTRLPSVLDLKNYNGEHCVHLATFGQHYDFLRYLNFRQADMNSMEGRSGKTALHYAVNMGDEFMVRLLAEPKEHGGCGVWLNARDWAGRTALQCAKINGDDNIFRYLSSLPGCDTSMDESDEDFEFDTDEDAELDNFNDIEINGIRTVESKA